MDYEETRQKSSKEEAIKKYAVNADSGENALVSQTMSMKAYKKWKKFRKVAIDSEKYIPSDMLSNGRPLDVGVKNR